MCAQGHRRLSSQALQESPDQYHSHSKSTHRSLQTHKSDQVVYSSMELALDPSSKEVFLIFFPCH